MLAQHLEDVDVECTNYLSGLLSSILEKILAGCELSTLDEDCAMADDPEIVELIEYASMNRAFAFAASLQCHDVFMRTGQVLFGGMVNPNEDNDDGNFEFMGFKSCD